MSLILLDDILFNDSNPERHIQYDNCLLFIILNSLSILCGIFFNFYSAKVPQKDNNHNNLTRLFISFNSILSCLYLIILIKLFFLDSYVDYIIKFPAMFCPMMTFVCYYWTSCLAHNMYTTYYHYRKNLDKRVRFYKYQCIMFSFIIYLLTLFNLKFEEEDMLNNSFTFMVYGFNFINLFYLIGVIFFIYIIHRVYYILNKKQAFLTLSLGDMHDATIRQIFDALVQRHMVFIYLFLVTYLPMNFTMIIRMTFGFSFFGSYYLDFMTFTLISVQGIVIFCVKLSDPVMRNFIHSFFTRDHKIYDMLDSTMTNHNNSIITNDSFIHDDRYSTLLVQPEGMASSPICKIEMKQYNYVESAASSAHKGKYFRLKEHKKITPNSLNPAMEIPLKQNMFGLQEDDEAIAISDNKSEMSDVSDLHTCLSDNHYSKKRNSSLSLSKSCMNMFLKENYVSFALLNYHIDLDDNLQRMLAITISLSENRHFDIDDSYKQLYSKSLPWKEKSYYAEKTQWKEYTQDTIPDYILAKNDPRFKHSNFRVKSFAPLVFHHIQLIDNISIDSLIASLDPIKNLSMVNELRVTGGRSDNSISTSWDKKILIKTISKTEKQLFKSKMLKEYHERMRDTKSLLCRIYGLFKIELIDKGSIHVLLQKNMCELPTNTSLLIFDLKGSTVDRQCIVKSDQITMTKQKLMSKYKNKVLKDTDLSILNVKLNLNPYDGKNLLTCIENDSLFLQKYGVTDYSLLIFIHKYCKRDINTNFGNLRIMKSNDSKYLFNFSIIDFLGTFNFEKKSEKLAKEIVSLMKKTKDTNFSCLDPINYGNRFRNYGRSIINIQNGD